MSIEIETLIDRVESLERAVHKSIEDSRGIPHNTVREDNTTSAGYTYTGFATPGSVTSAAVWLVIRTTDADGTLLFADGNKIFDNIWDNRASLSYS